MARHGRLHEAKVTGGGVIIGFQRGVLLAFFVWACARMMMAAAVLRCRPCVGA